MKCEEFKSIELDQIPEVIKSLGLDFCQTFTTEEHQNIECIVNFSEDDFSAPAAVKVEIHTEKAIPGSGIPENEKKVFPDAEAEAFDYFDNLYESVTENLSSTNAEAIDYLANLDEIVSKGGNVPVNKMDKKQLKKLKKKKKCLVCNKICYNDYNWRRHMQTVHKVLIEGKPPVKIKETIKLPKKKKLSKECHICLEPVSSFRKGILIYPFFKCNKLI